MDYGITNVSGKPSEKEVFNILSLAWENGIRRFDTAPGYGSEAMLGKFIKSNGLQNEAKVLTKIPSLDGYSDYRTNIRISIETSLKHFGCPIDVLFFHNPDNSSLLKKDAIFFENLLDEYDVETLGLSVYEPNEVEKLSASQFDLAFQFPFNVLDRRFEKLNMPQGKRYARSVFLQGLLASPKGLRLNAHAELLNFQKEYHNNLADHQLYPVSFAISFVALNAAVDYFLLGVDNKSQLQDIIDLKPYDQQEITAMDTLQINEYEPFLDPRSWF